MSLHRLNHAEVVWVGAALSVHTIVVVASTRYGATSTRVLYTSVAVNTAPAVSLGGGGITVCNIEVSYLYHRP